MPIKAISLDLDGTLLDTIADLAAAANAMRSDFGLPPLPQSRLESFVGGGMAQLVHRALTDDRDGKAQPELHETGIASFCRHYDRLLAVSTRPYPGVLEGLQAFKQMGLKLAVITNKPYRFSLPILEKTGLAPYFSMVLGGDSLTEKKPHPLPLLHACQQFGCQPAELLMVGDSHFDRDAAVNAGSPCLLLTYGYDDISSLTCQGHISSLVEAVEFVKNVISLS
ncbi:phosphoglycolate phosphatase [Chitinimonas sp. BJB300]|uniref:phosphoglycolate phosphatase n=1 Tax=Chitinimonas sp. BJB300 TaxID=1559339 RepID=UPI000C0EEC7E|nr:phosphoglycolate phosphatase [Chitinimonas sp. BJB300]PHV13138.1 phosphoglycolate phosphatase [Chitinimonas sp. BJB300]TSJ84735.1 phosphoglycolate phosphatase [Chitinimonas sp. BJB300]